jgi:hypothetical protein
MLNLCRVVLYFRLVSCRVFVSYRVLSRLCIIVCRTVDFSKNQTQYD